MTTDISNRDDLIDIRDVIERVEDLRSLRTPGPVAVGDDDDTDQDQLFAELATLEALLEECEGNGGDEQWEGAWYPVTLIRDSYFEDYARELVKDIGDLPRGIPNYIVIDWEATARNIRMDYTPIEFDGVTYWVR